MKKTLSLILILFCLAYALIRGLSYLSIVQSPHSYEEASRWIYEHIEPGAIILGVHWDDKLPLHLPGFNPSQYGYHWADSECELPLYEPDNEQKLNLVTERLVKGDYLVFPTQRIPGSIPRIPNEQPHTIALLQLLYAGKLGYQLVANIKTRPSFGSFVFDDDLADESFSVYDHPPVTVFKNTEKLSSQVMRERILSKEGFQPLPSLKDILKRGSSAPAYDSPPNVWLEVLKWFSFVWLLGYVFFPLVAYVFPEAPDKGFGFSRLIALFILGFFSWILPWLFKTPFDALTVWMVFVMGLAISGLIISQTKGGLLSLLPQKLMPVIMAEVLFWCGVFLFLVLRSFQPEIFWGEKPMDFTFLNYFIRFEKSPIEEPWASGQPMRYYYLGTYILAGLHKATGVDPGTGYNLALITISGLLISGSYSLILMVSHKVWLSLMGALSLILISNFDVLRLAIIKGQEINFDLYWASSRTLSSPGINEYPLWSHLFGDLHAHLIALPFTLLILAGCLSILIQKGEWAWKKTFPFRLLHGAVLGSLIGFNTWDFISYGFLSGLFMLASLFLRLIYTKEQKVKVVTEWMGEGMALACGCLLCGLPLYLEVVSASGVHYGWVTGAEFNSLRHIFLHFGHWIIPILASVILLGAKLETRLNYAFFWKLPLALFLGSPPIILGFFSWRDGSLKIPWDILSFSSLLLIISIFFILRKEKDKVCLVAAMLLYSASLMLSVVELVFLMDRMNTTFKFYNALWFLFGSSAVLFISYAVTKTNSFFRYSIISLVVLSFIPAFSGSLVNIWVMTRFKRIEVTRPTLDGQAYLALHNPEELKLFRWIRSSVPGLPYVLEAQGNSYGAFTRLSMHTGLPCLLGWEHHVMQRGTPHEEMIRRKEEIKTIYSTSDSFLAFALLSKYKIQYVLVGKLEHDTYPDIGLKKFERNPNSYIPVFESGNTKLYEVKYNT